MRVYLTPFEIIPRSCWCLQLIFKKTIDCNIERRSGTLLNAKAAPELLDSPGRRVGLIHFQLFKLCKEFRIQYFDIRTFHAE